MKLLKQPFYLLCLLLYVSQSLSAQAPTQNQKYIPPSPAAMVFQKYVDYPVDISTGLPQINIPLYTIALKDYSFPISASFHASGRKTAWNFSPLGMNWALLASGVINREVRGKPDETITGGHYEKAVSFYTPQSAHYDDILSIDPNATNCATYNRDSEYDIYSINVNGISAKFVIKDNGTVTFLTYAPYTLTKGAGGFVLTDDKGVIYKFGSDGAGYGYSEITTTYLMPEPTSWYLSSITTPSGSKIQFKYDRPTVYTNNWIGNQTYSDRIVVQDADIFNTSAQSTVGGYQRTAFDGYYNYQDAIHPYNNESDITYYNMCYVSEINFDNGKIQFSYPPNNTTTNFLLNSLTVTNSKSEIIKTVCFSYFSSLPGTNLTLPNNNSRTIQFITFQDDAGTGIEKYSFDYWPGKDGGDMTSFSKGKDWWGYANLMPGDWVANNQVPIQSVHIDHGAYDERVEMSYDVAVTGSENCKLPKFNAKLVGMIKAIHYPTGGSSNFTYESNIVYNAQGNPVEGPGLRIQKIISYDGFGNQTGKTYEYPVPGHTAVIPDKYDYFTEKRRMLFTDKDVSNPSFFYQALLGSYKYREYTSDPVPEVQAASQGGVYYQQVNEYSYSIGNVKNGRTKYVYTLPEYVSSSVSLTLPSGTIGGTDYFTPQVHSFNEWTTPQLSSKVIEKWDTESGTYKTVSSTSINYTTLNIVNIPQVSLYQHLEFPNVSFCNSSFNEPVPKTLMTNPAYNWQVYALIDRPIQSAIKKPQSETTITYDDNGNSLSNITNYFYGNLVHINPTKVETTTSDAKTITRYINYPQDYAAGTAFIDNLRTKNILAVPIEEVDVQTVGGASKITSGKITTYTGTAVNQVFKLETAAPVLLSGFKFSNRATGVLPVNGTATAFSKDSKYKTQVTINNYDSKNNPLTITPENNNPVSYIWGYNQYYPIAEVNNAPSKNIFYTSFEETDGNSSPGDSKTGKLSRTTSYSKALTGLDNGTYILSYWKKTGSSWALNTSTVTVSTGSYTINLTGQTDELKFYPQGSVMSTYTYEPLVGMTSSTDIKNYTTYYSYDSYKRLLAIKDDQLKILKQYNYNYVNPSFFNTAQSGTFTKTGCGLGYLGSTVTYTVPDGAYSSAISVQDANNKAIADVNAKGQEYANANGNCFNYKNQEERKVFTKACSAGLYGSEIEYIVPYGKHTSVISVADAQAKATNDINTNGQNYANTLPSGKCYTYDEAFKNDAINVTLTKNNCPIGYTGSAYANNPFIIPYGKYVSTVSKYEANAQANAELVAKQVSVNNSGTCIAQPTILIQVSNSTHYDVTIVFSNSQGSITYTAVKDSYYGTVAVPVGTYNTISMTPMPSSSNKFHFYLGSAVIYDGSALFNNVQPANTISITN